MSVVAEKFTSPSKTTQPILRSKLGRIVDLHHPTAMRILDLQATAKRLINGPNAYRSADFVKWHKATADLYAEFYQAGLPPEYEDRFYQRGFGRVKAILTDDQIYEAFKADMRATVKDFQHIIMTLKANQANTEIITTSQAPNNTFLTPKLLIAFVTLTAISIVALVTFDLGSL